MVKPDTPSHQKGVPRGEDLSSTDHSGRDGDTRNQRDATSINPDQRRPILPGMPQLPPA